LRGLTRLEIEACEVSSIPDDIANLSQLESLNACNNSIQVLPKSLFQLPRLIELDATDNNNIQSVDKSILGFYQIRVRGQIVEVTLKEDFDFEIDDEVVALVHTLAVARERERAQEQQWRMDDADALDRSIRKIIMMRKRRQ
jgi:Leucine-rich repeat (LRR) protein